MLKSSTRFILSACIVCLLIFSMVGCGSQHSNATGVASESAPTPESASKNADVTKCVVKDLSLTHPSSWRVTDADDNGKYIYPTFGGMLYVAYVDDMTPVQGETKTISDFLDGMEKADGLKLDRSSGAVFKAGKDSTSVYVFPMTYEMDGVQYKGEVDLVCDWPCLYNVVAASPLESYDSNNKEVSDVLSSIELRGENLASTAGKREAFNSKAEQKTDSQQTSSVQETKQQEKTEEDTAKATIRTSQSSEQPSASSPTVSQSNALKKALQYLDYSAFSYSGLVEQLEFEGFSTEDATYGVDHCGADWNQQAANKAKQYLDYSAFSHDGLVEQLEFEGFSHEQAEYGVSSVGL